jgi:hypothetical protein
MGQALFVAAFDSQLKWCAMISKELAARGFDIHVAVPDTRSALSPHQVVDAERVVRALRQVGIAAWDRTGKGNWAPHIHGVPLPGAGFAAGSAIWQAQDYLRGGDGRGGRDNGPRVGIIEKIGAVLNERQI